jgi:hypothetical protein
LKKPDSYRGTRFADLGEITEISQFIHSRVRRNLFAAARSQMSPFSDFYYQLCISPAVLVFTLAMARCTAKEAGTTPFFLFDSPRGGFSPFALFTHLGKIRSRRNESS